MEQLSTGWGPDSGIGVTATGCAASRALASRRFPNLICDPYADLLVAAVGNAELTAMARDEGPESLGDDLEAALGFTTARTKYFDDFLSASGLTQVVILGAGLDTRAFRLPWPAGTVVFELDQPEVTTFKTRTLRRAGICPTAHRKDVGVDLRFDWRSVLTDAGFRPERPTAWMAEGLFGYLPPDAETALLDRITSLSAAGSRAGVEYVDTTDLADALRTDVSTIARTGVGLTAPPSDLIHDGPRTGIADTLRSHGWDLSEIGSPQLYATHDLPRLQDPTALINRFVYLDAIKH